MEALRPTPQEAERAAIRRRLDEIDASVRAGETDLRALGFWRVVEAIKRDRVLTIALADQCGRIDAAAFSGRVRFRIRFTSASGRVFTT